MASVSLGAVGISGGKVKMDTPRLSGYRKDNRPYEVTAEAACRKSATPHRSNSSNLPRGSRWSAKAG